VREPWRVALALLHETCPGAIPRDLPLFGVVPQPATGGVLRMLERGVNAPVTTSAGRLFDGFAALLGLSYANTHQAESAQCVEYAAWRHGRLEEPLPLPLVDGEGIAWLDWRPLVLETLEGLRGGTPPDRLAAAFHHALAAGAVAVAQRTRARRLALTGGCFANRYLTETLLERAGEAGLEALVHSQLPPGDGSLCVGQLWVAANRLAAT
jgi:hydrogenase maturation protein HypF